MKEHSFLRDFDWWLLLLALALCALGLVEIHSATRNPGMANMTFRQLGWIGLGLVIMLVLTRIDYHTILDHAPWLYLLSLAALLAVLALGHTHFGARRWMAIGGVPVQVSELVKFVIIVALARYFSELRTDCLAILDWIKIGAILGIPVVLILLQPDMGTALSLVPVAVVGALMAKVEWKHVLVLVIIAALLLPFGWHFVLKPYQKARLTSFIHPQDDPQHSGYQILQSEIAVGSGGLWGKGIGKGSQSQLGFVPVQYSDFILAALAEEQGFIGVVLALALYVGLLLRLMNNAEKAVDRAGMYVVVGTVAILSFQVFVNVAMVIGYMPVTGIPLPLMSYGGSATLFVFMALGLAMNVRVRRFVN